MSSSILSEAQPRWHLSATVLNATNGDRLQRSRSSPLYCPTNCLLTYLLTYLLNNPDTQIMGTQAYASNRSIIVLCHQDMAILDLIRSG